MVPVDKFPWFSSSGVTFPRWGCWALGSVCPVKASFCHYPCLRLESLQSDPWSSLWTSLVPSSISIPVVFITFLGAKTTQIHSLCHYLLSHPLPSLIYCFVTWQNSNVGFFSSLTFSTLYPKELIAARENHISVQWMLIKIKQQQQPPLYVSSHCYLDSLLHAIVKYFSILLLCLSSRMEFYILTISPRPAASFFTHLISATSGHPYFV